MENKKYIPTESELEVLQILWERGRATVREVHEILEQFKETGYTTTLKTMQNMIEKGLLVRDTNQRTHIYKPLLSRDNAEKHFLNKMINGLFKGSATRMVMGALDNKGITSEEIKEIKDFLKQFEK